MHPPAGPGFLRRRCLVAFSCALLAAAFCSAAQGQEIVYSVGTFSTDKAWPKMSVRADGKLTALSFSFETQTPVDIPSTGKLDKPEGEGTLQIPVGDPALLWWQEALVGGHIRPGQQFSWNFVTRSFLKQGQEPLR